MVDENNFRVIFTIKDHGDRLIAQEMTNSIMITDDHKTHVAPISAASQNAAHAERAQLPGAGVFPREPTGLFTPAPVRNAYSTTDLQNLRQTFGPHLLQKNSPFFTPQNFSHSTSATLTPQNLSRPVSPSATSERHQKRRKGSGSGIGPSALIMTQLNTTDAPRTPMSDLTSAGPSNGVSSGVAPYSMGGWAVSNHSGDNPPYVRPLPNYLECRRAEPRSQSMEDLAKFQSSFSAHNSAVASGISSRVASPTSNEPQNHMPLLPQSQQHGQVNLPVLQTNAINTSGSPVVATQRQPTIHKLIPAEGSISGGIEVTCLGSGFHPGLQVMFGNALATTTTFWGESSLVCLLPPALYAGPVGVRFAHNYPHNNPTPSMQNIYFTYINDDEPQIIKNALMTLVHKFTGRTEDSSEIVRKMRNGTLLGSEHRNGNGMSNGNGSGFISHVAAAPHLQASEVKSGFVDPVDLETWLLRCLDLIDLDDSPFPSQLNMTRPNGQTMLHLSASLGFYRFVAALLARGAHPDLRDRNGMSPMHIASLHNHSNIVRKLRLAGGDPRLRSLRGYTPADMASTQEMCDIIDALERSSWSQSARATPTSQQTRASSVASFPSVRGSLSTPESVAPDNVLRNETDAAISSDERAPSQGSNVAATPQLWVRSRRNSTTEDKLFLDDRTSGDAAGNDRLHAWSVWRDQIATQIQQLQQSMHRTLPNLPMPNLPPMPYFLDYQDYPMVRRISSLVPQRYPLSISRDSKDSDYHWWELLRGTTAPPPYDELFPHEEQHNLDVKNASAVLAAGDALIDENCTAEFDRGSLGNTSVLETIKVESQTFTQQQRAELIAAHAMKVKRLRSDRNLFFFWVKCTTILVFPLVDHQIDSIIGSSDDSDAQRSRSSTLACYHIYSKPLSAAYCSRLMTSCRDPNYEVRLLESDGVWSSVSRRASWKAATQKVRKLFQDKPFEFPFLVEFFATLISDVSHVTTNSDIACLTQFSFSPDGKLNMCLQTTSVFR